MSEFWSNSDLEEEYDKAKQEEEKEWKDEPYGIDMWQKRAIIVPVVNEENPEQEGFLVAGLIFNNLRGKFSSERWEESGRNFVYVMAEYSKTGEILSAGEKVGIN